MSSSKNPNSETSASSSLLPFPSSRQAQTHRTPSSVAASEEDTPDQESPNQETETPERASEIMNTGEAELNPVQSVDKSPEEEEEEEEDSDDNEDVESIEEEFDPDEEIILFSETSNDNEEYDDVTFLRYIHRFEQHSHTMPLPICIDEPPPTRYDMDDLIRYIKRYSGAAYVNFSRCRCRNKIMRLQNKYRNIVQEKGENPTLQDFSTHLGKLHFDLMKIAFVWLD